MGGKKIENLSIKDYIEVEQATNTRYEYHDGVIYAMAGGSIEHGLISGNTYGELKSLPEKMIYGESPVLRV